MFGWGRRRPAVVAFDIIETVFPLEPLRAGTRALGLPGAGLEAWFAAALRDAFALSATGDFAPFTTVLEGALDQVLGDCGLAAPRRAKQRLIEGLQRLPPRPDAGAAFETVLRAGMGVIALSNGSASATRALLDRAGLLDMVRHVVSVEEVGLYKPRPEVYAHAARVAGVRPARMALIAVHPWDIHGASAAGWTAAFVSAERPFSRALRAPAVAEPTLLAAAQALADI